MVKSETVRSALGVAVGFIVGPTVGKAFGFEGDGLGALTQAHKPKGTVSIRRAESKNFFISISFHCIFRFRIIKKYTIVLYIMKCIKHLCID